MTSDWILRNLWAWSLHAGANVAMVALCLALLRVRAPRTRLGLLEAAFGSLLCLTPLISLLAYWHGVTTLPTSAAGVRTVESLVTSAVAAAIPGAMAWTPFLVGIWVAGAVLRAAWLCLGLRRLRQGSMTPAPEAIETEARELQTLLRTRARLEWRDDIMQPATFGWFCPRVLLPSTLLHDEPVRRRAILCHELVHVSRADWHHVVLEEAARSVFWFHPGVHWLIAELRVVREQVVDREVVERLGDRTAYLNVLYAYASHETAAAGVAPFFGRRQLERRVKSLLTEVSMSRLHRLTVNLAIAVLVGGAVGAATYWYPLDLFAATASPRTQDTGGAAGPLERAAKQVSDRASTPRRTHATSFVFPAEARGVLASAVVTVRLVVDDTGAVAEARVLRLQETWRGHGDTAAMATATRLVMENALNTIRQWRYEPPAAPVFWTMTVFYSDGPGKAEQPPSDEGDALASAGAGGKALRVGGAVRPPEKLATVAPTYPQEALDAGIEGVVSIEATIDATGTVSDARVVKSVPELDDAALEAVRQWKYRPTLLNGAPVPVIMTVTINFALPR
jgi:TonB family protein